MKKGFTLTELLVVIAIIGILTVIAVPSITLVTKNINKRSYNNKVEMIRSAAELYASNKPEIFNGNLEVKIYVADLLNADYLKIEQTNDTENVSCTKTIINSKEVVTKGCIINPVSKESMNSNWVLLKKEAVGIVSSFNGDDGGNDNDNLVKAICDKFNKGEDGFTGKYGEVDDEICECLYEDNVNKTGEVVGLVAVSPNDKKGTKVEACLISGYEKNNYLYYDNRYFRVLGLYDLSSSEKGGYGIVPKLITDDGVETE